MTRKELEHKITKALHKANHAKTLKLKLEKVNEVLDTIQRLLAGISTESPHEEARLQAENSVYRLKQYRELCRIHKLKFQLDALLYGVSREKKEFSKAPDQMTQERFDSLVRRLNVILDTDPEHPEALELLNDIHRNFSQYAKDSSVRDIYIDLSPYQAKELSIAFECPLKSITQHEKLAGQYQTYLSKNHKKEEHTIRLKFSSKQFEAFAAFHEELHTCSEYRIFVNGARIGETQFSEWFHCYRRYLKADKPQYCYGASPFTLNVFGCHKLSLPDIANQLGKCWFNRGELDRESGLFLIASEQIANDVRQQLKACGFCPFLSQEKLGLGMGILPPYINPECDPQWEYLYQDNSRVGVVPVGSEIAIALQPQEEEKINPSKLIEVNSSPYALRILEYVISRDKHVLNESRYKGITRCLNCGTHYKAHTMVCPNCKSDFVKDALADLDKALRELSYTQPVKYPRHSQKPQPSPLAESPRQAVSFDQLWNDPQIRKILSNDSAGQEPARDAAPEASEKNRRTDAQPLVPPEPKRAPSPKTDEIPAPPHPLDEEVAQSHRRSGTASRFDLHGKLRSLVSKKYRERKAIEDAFSDSDDFTLPAASEEAQAAPPRKIFNAGKISATPVIREEGLTEPVPDEHPSYGGAQQEIDEELAEAIKRLRPRQKSELSKRGVVRVIYHATMDKDHCPLCAYLDGMVMDPDDPGTDIFSPPLYPGCTCSREYVLKTEKPSKWPEVNFRFPPKELLNYLQRH